MAKKSLRLFEYYSSHEINDLSIGNQIITDVVKLMLSGGTFIFILSGTLFGARIVELPLCLKVLLIISWAFIFISFAFGFCQLIGDSSFLGKWARNYRKAMQIVAEYRDNEEEGMRLAAEELKNEKLVSNMSGFWAQLIFLAIAFTMQLVIVSIFLF